MSTQQLRDATSNQGAVANRQADEKSIMGLMSSDSVKKQMALAMPKHMTPDRLMRIAMTEVRKVPALAKCNVQSFMGAIMQCAQLGIEPGSALGHAYLLPFGNGKANDGLANCQLIIGYRGMIDLARRSGQIISLSARSVHQNDEFHYTYGLEETLTHIPATDNRGDLTHVYAVAKLKGGGVQFEVMSKSDVMQIKASSKAGNNGPWVSHFDEMAKKSVIRRLFKYLPVSIEVTQAVILDEKADAGIDQDNASALTGEFTVFAEPERMEYVDTEPGEVTDVKQPALTKEEKAELKAEAIRKKKEAADAAAAQAEQDPEPDADFQMD